MQSLQTIGRRTRDSKSGQETMAGGVLVEGNHIALF